MRKTRLLTLLVLLMTAATGAWAQEVIPVTLDFTSNSWGIPSGTEEKTAAENSYTSGGYTITLCGSSGNGYYFSPTEPYILLGKQGAYLQLPAFSSAVDSIKVVGSPNASTSVEQNIYVDDNNSWVAVSTPTTGMKNVTQKYVIDENYRAAGNIYVIKVDNNYNTQIKKVLVYFTPATYTVSLKDGVKDADKWTVKVGEGQAQALPIGGLKGDGTETVTLQYNGRLKVKGVKATSDAAPAGPKAAKDATAEDLGKVIGADGNIYDDADAATAANTTAVAMIAYVGNGSDCTNGLAIQLNASPESMNWNVAKTYASGLTAVPGGTWRLPSKADWQNMFVGCAKSGDASVSDSMDPIAGFKEKIEAAGITWNTDYYWSSTDSGSDAWDVFMVFDGSYAVAFFYEAFTSEPYSVRACLAF